MTAVYGVCVLHVGGGGMKTGRSNVLIGDEIETAPPFGHATLHLRIQDAHDMRMCGNVGWNVVLAPVQLTTNERDLRQESC